MITCDLGSNTLRVLKFDCKTKKRVREFEKVVRTAQNLYKTNVICEESIQRIFSALEEANELIDFKSDEVHCVTTEAMRRAENSAQIIKQIQQKFGIDFNIIDGEEEARLTLLGIEMGLEEAKISTDNYVMMDLGGGSTEISFKKDGITISKSFPFGIVTTAEIHQNIENIEKNIQNITFEINDFIKENKINLSEYKKFVATAGTPTTVAAFIEGIDYKSYSYEQINGKVLHVDDFIASLKSLLKLDEKQREFWVGTNRSDLVCAGILIVKDIMQKLNFQECIVIDNGLREGLAISKCNIQTIN